MFHFRKTFKNYKNIPRSETCAFCESVMQERVVRETKYTIIVPNLVKYDLWEFRDVTEHLLVIPKRHVKSLSELTPTEAMDVMEILREYEGNDYNIYARSKNSIMRSVGHQHTHLIKTKNGNRAKFGLFIKKPYLLIKF